MFYFHGIASQSLVDWFVVKQRLVNRSLPKSYGEERKELKVKFISLLSSWCSRGRFKRDSVESKLMTFNRYQPRAFYGGSGTMIRTTTRALGALLIAFLGLSTVHVSAQVEADAVLDTVAFGQPVDSIALNTVMDEDGDRVFSDADIRKELTCTVSHHNFNSSVTNVAGDTDNDDLVEAEATAFSGVSCTTSGAGAGKILTITIPAGAAQVDDDQGVAKLTIDPAPADVAEGETGFANNDAKVLDLKVLHNIVVKDDLDGICGLEDVEGTDTISLSVNVGECDAADFFDIQVDEGVSSFTYALTADPTVTEISSAGVITKTGVLAETVTVTAQAMRGRGTSAATQGGVQATGDISFVGTAGRSTAGKTAHDSSARSNSLALGETDETLNLGTWFVLAAQSNENPVSYSVDSTSNIEADLDIHTLFTAGPLYDTNNDGVVDTSDTSVEPGVYADLTVKAIGTGTGSVTVTVTQGIGDDAVSVFVKRAHMVNATQVFQVLSFEMLDDWVENTNGRTDEDDPATDADESRDGMDLLNEAIAGNIKSETAELDVDFSVSSEPAGLFALKMTKGDNPVVVIDGETGAPTIEWATDKEVPDAETYDEMVVTLTAKPAGSNADEENLAVTIGIADAEDPTVPAKTCKLVLEGIFAHESSQHPVPKSDLVDMGRACGGTDEDDEITSVVDKVEPACTMDEDDNMTFPEDENVCVVSPDDDETNFVIHTKAADEAGTNATPVKFTVTAGGSDTKPYVFTKEVVVLTGANTPPRFRGGASQATVDAVKENYKGAIGPAEAGAWTAKDVNAAGDDGLDKVTHALQGANAMGIAGGAHLGYCLSANAETGAVSTATCGMGASAFSGLNFERLTTVVSEATEEKGEVRSFTVNLIASDEFRGTATLEIVIQVENVPMKRRRAMKPTRLTPSR